MWLRIITTALMITTMVVLLLSGVVVGKRPPESSPKAEKVAYLRRSAAFVGIEAAALIGSLIGAWMIVRRARADFRAQSEENFKSLLEGTLRDHKRPTEEES
jgi:hypothetical protein